MMTGVIFPIVVLCPARLRVRILASAFRAAAFRTAAVASADCEAGTGLVGSADHDRAVQIGAIEAGAGGAHQADGAGHRVAVGVSGAHRDDRDAGADRPDEVRILVAAAVVWDLQHVRAKRRAVDGEQVGLDRLLDVAGEEDPESGCGGGRGRSRVG